MYYGKLMNNKTEFKIEKNVDEKLKKIFDVRLTKKKYKYIINRI